MNAPEPRHALLDPSTAPATPPGPGPDERRGALATADEPVLSLHRRVLLVDDMPSIHDDFRRILLPDAGPAAAPALDALEAALFAAPAGAGPLARPGAPGTGPALQPAFTLDSALQGQQALDLLRRAQLQGEPYAMAFVDMRMPPGWDGVRTIEELWAQDPALQVVICTAYADGQWPELLARLDPGDRLLILKKPFDAIEVLQMAHALTAKWTAARQVQRHARWMEAEVQRRTEALQQANALLNQQIGEHQRQNDVLQQQRDHIRHLALHDPLTGLANRAQLMERLRLALLAAQASGRHVGLLFIDLDRFKPINDTLGHAVGDRLLQAVAAELRRVVRQQDLAARLGGDEFVLLFEDVGETQILPMVAQRVLERLSRPLEVDGQALSTGASVGVACGPGDGASVEALMHAADQAMYAAKAAGRNAFRCHDPALGAPRA